MSTVEIINMSSEDVAVSDVTVPARRRAVVSYKRFAQLAVDADIPSMSQIEVVKERNVPSRCSVAEFGARGSGTVDDTRAFQRAVSYLESNGGGVLEIPAGIYPVSGIDVTAPVRFEGAGAKGTTLKHTGDGALFDIRDAGDVTIAHVTIRGVGGLCVVRSESSEEQQVTMDCVRVPNVGTEFSALFDIDEHAHVCGGITSD